MSRFTHIFVFFAIFFNISIVNSGNTKGSSSDKRALETFNDTADNHDIKEGLGHKTSGNFRFLLPPIWRNLLETLTTWLRETYVVSHEESQPLSREAKGKLFRMPEVSGKRDSNRQSAQAVSRLSPSNEPHLSSVPQGAAAGAGSYFPDSQDIRVQLPVTESGPAQEDTGLTGQDEHVSGARDDRFTRESKGRLGRMPMAFGKRSKREAEVLDESQADFTPVLEDEVRSHFMNKDYSFDPSTTDYIDTNFRSASVPDMGRTSDTSGKQSEASSRHGPALGLSFARSAQNAPFKISSVFETEYRNDQTKKLNTGHFDSVLYSLKKDNTPLVIDDSSHNRFDYDDSLIRFDRQRKGSLARMPLTFGKRGEKEMMSPADGNALFNRFSKGSLGRMPLTFGKRVQNKNTEYARNPFFHREAKGRLQRMPAVFGKRESSMDYQFLLQLLRSKMSSLKSRDPEVLNQKLQDLFEELLSEGTWLARPARSKMERMPLTFGKRDSMSPGAINYLASIHTIRTRSKLDRMPLTYGKKASETFSLPEELSANEALRVPFRSGPEPKENIPFMEYSYGNDDTNMGFPGRSSSEK